MEFNIETLNDHPALTAMAKALRKIYRRKSSIVLRIAGLLVVLLGVYCSTPLSGREFSFSTSAMISYFALLMILLMVVWEDGVNGFFAVQRLPASSRETEARFQHDHYCIETDLEITSWQYQRITYLAESRYYFIFVFNKNHAQVFDKEYLSGGTEEEFKSFISEKTGKEFIRV